MRGAKSMGAKQTRRVIIVGAGFSAPAQLPVQNRIIQKMTEEPQGNFLQRDIFRESIKFSDAYITVGLFLLNHYGKKNHRLLENTYKKLRRIDSFDEYYAGIFPLEERVRVAIKKEQINTDLEDVFTSIDKAILSKEYFHEYTYGQTDEIRYSLMRLFIYYFSKCVLDHSFEQKEYLDFIKYIRSREAASLTTIVTTNWDTLIEGYLERNHIRYNYGFQSPYASDGSSLHEDDTKKLLLLKIHGSANWLRCLHCGAISVYPDNEAADSLFEDGKWERCRSCYRRESPSAPSLQPEIITPTMVKSLTSRLYLNLWGAAGSRIQSATHIVFVGYSLPVADFDFRYLLQRNVSSAAKIDVVLCKDDKPGKDDRKNLRDLLPERRYKKAFPKNELSFYYDGFGKYFEDALGKN